ncbi:hypothetical protein IQA88_19000, partial [Leptospira interrogans serovar Pomona]
NHRNAEGITPLLKAILKRRIALSEKLLELGADPNISDTQGRTPLEEVRKQKLTDLETLILKKNRTNEKIPQ